MVMSPVCHVKPLPIGNGGRKGAGGSGCGGWRRGGRGDGRRRSERRWRRAPAADPQPSPRAPRRQWHHHLLQPALHLPRYLPTRSVVRPPGPLEACGPRAALTALFSSEMWYGVFLWALVSSLAFHVPAALLALFTLRHHKYGRFMSVSVLLMGIVGPITAGTLTSTASAPGGCADQRLPSGARGMAVFPRMEISVLPLFPPCPKLERVAPYPVSSPASGIPNVPWVQSQGGSHISEHMEENLSEVWCQCPEVGNVCSLWAVGGGSCDEGMSRPPTPAEGRVPHQFTHCHQHALVPG